MVLCPIWHYDILCGDLDMKLATALCQLPENRIGRTGEVADRQVQDLSSSGGFASIHMPNEHHVHVFPAQCGPILSE